MISERTEYFADGENFSRQELKSRLHQMDVEYNVNEQKKNYFVEIYREAIKDPAKREKIREKLAKDAEPKDRPIKRRGQESEIDHRTTLDLPSKKPKLNLPEEEKNQEPVNNQRDQIISNPPSENIQNEIPSSTSPNANRINIVPTVTTARIRIPGDYRNYNSTGEPSNFNNLNINNIPKNVAQSPRQRQSGFNINNINNINNSSKPKSPQQVSNENKALSGNNQPKVSPQREIKVESTKSHSGNINQIPSSGIIFNPLPTNMYKPSGSTFSFGVPSTIPENIPEFNNQINQIMHSQFEELKKEVINNEPRPRVEVPDNINIPVVNTVADLSPKNNNSSNVIVNGGVHKQPSPVQVAIGNQPESDFVISTSNTNLSVNRQPPLRPFREEDRWSISKRRPVEEDKPILTIQMLVKYFLTGVVCSVMFFGIYYCIQNCPEFNLGWNFSPSQEKILSDIPGKVAETVNPRSYNLGIEEATEIVQEESYLHYLWTYFVSGAENTKWALTHPKSFILDVILSGLKYVAYEWLWYWFKNNLWYILGIFTLKFIAYKSYKLVRDRLTANQAFKSIKSKLKDIYENENYPVGMTEEEIIKDLSREYNIHEEHFKYHIMPRLKTLRQSDKEVKISYKEVQGRPKMVWIYSDSL